MRHAALPPGPENPYGNAYAVGERVLPTEQAAQRNVGLRQDALLEDHQSGAEDLGRPAHWLQARGGLASAPLHSSRQPVGDDAPASSSISSGSLPFNPDERYPAASSSTSRPGKTGLRLGAPKIGRWRIRTLVLWHSFGLHHLPRPEDHPVQPCISCGFKLCLQASSIRIRYRPAEVEERGKLLRLRGEVNDRQVLAVG